MSISNNLQALIDLISNGYEYLDSMRISPVDANDRSPIIIRMKKGDDIQTLQYAGDEMNRALLIFKKNNIVY